MKETDGLEVFLKDVLKNAEVSSGARLLESDLQYITNERIRITDNIRQLVFELGGDKAKAEILVADTQKEITVFSNAYYKRLNSDVRSDYLPNPTFASQIVKTLLDELDVLYITLKDNYPDLFNTELPVPLSLKDKHIAAVNNLNNATEDELKKRELAEAFVNLIVDYLGTDVRQSSYPLLNSREIDYHSMLSKSLSQLVINSSKDNLKEKLFGELIYFNLNCLPLINYYLKEIQRDYDQIENYKDEQMQLILDQRNIKSLPINQKYSFQPEAISLKDILYGAVVEEINCIEQMQRIQEKVVYKDWPSSMISPFYFHVSITLEQLTFLFRIMIEAGIVLVKKKIELFDFIAKHIGTVNKENLAHRSIKNKFGNPTYATVQKVKHMLLLLINLINEKYPA